MLAITDRMWPDPDEAGELIRRELENDRYSQAQPSWWDRLVQSIVDFFTGIFDPNVAQSAGPIIMWVIAGVVVALAILAILVWGRPRVSLTSQATPDALFSDDDSRSALELRTAAARCAQAGDFDQAVILATRALARGLDERGIVVLSPGATVQHFAAEASASFPAMPARFAAAARLFDNVRYVRVSASPADYEGLRAFDADVQGARASRLSELPTVNAG